MYYLQLLGKVVGHEGSEGGKQWCKEHAHIAYVYGDVQPIKYMINGGWGHHEAWIDGAWKSRKYTWLCVEMWFKVEGQW